MSWIFREPFDPALHVRRAYAPVRPAPPNVYPRSRAGGVLASLLGAGVYDDALFQIAPRRPTPKAIPPGDRGLSASLKVTFAGKGDDPYGGVGICVAPAIALG